MDKVIRLFCFLSIGVVVLVAAQKKPTSPNDLLDICFDGKYHKDQPGPESSLFYQCKPWKEHSCCTANTTVGIHSGNSMYNFNYSHCNSVKPMSQKCYQSFVINHCFYECSPNVGPWIVKENRSWRTERYFGVPLCAADCDQWFEDCKNDYTCTDNWSKNFLWKNGTCEGGRQCTTNFCPAKSKCFTFKQVYSNAKTFCETVFDGSWKYTADAPCMKIWFDGPNPNRKVAVLKANSMSAAGVVPKLSLAVTVPFLILTAVPTLWSIWF